MKKLSIIIIAFAISALAIRLQAADETTKKPGPEHKRLEILTGKWTIEEVAEKSPFGPAAKTTYDTVTRFVHDGFFVEEAGKARGDSPYSYTILHYYDAEARTYKTFYFDSLGNASPGITTFDGHTLKSSFDQHAQGKTFKCKSVSTLAPDAKSFEYEWSYSEDGTNWKTIFKGKGRKVGEAK